MLCDVNRHNIRVSGASFCHVERIRQLVHDIALITDGYHKWHGAAPSFSSSATVKMIDDIVDKYIWF